VLDAVIVGGGLFGQIIAAALRKDGRTVEVLDRGEKLAGSKPAACLMKPSWFSGLGKEVFEPSLQLLDELYRVHDIEFSIRPSGLKSRVHWCDPQLILSPLTRQEDVVAVRPGQVETARGEVIAARQVIVAAGFWTRSLLPEFAQVGQQGAAYLWPDTEGDNFISVWAPYRQLVGFNRGDGYWMGDGTAIKAENWTAERERATYARCAASAPRTAARPKQLIGIRPYAANRKPCLLENPSKGLWVASGGAKNGTLAAGWAAHKIKVITNE
jgi:glycine/D-amino acid oxidase-like deaminating enzyme